MKRLNSKLAEWVKSQGHNPDDYYLDEEKGQLVPYPADMGGPGWTFVRQMGLNLAPSIAAAAVPALMTAGAVGGGGSGTAVAPGPGTVAGAVGGAAVGLAAGVGTALIQDEILEAAMPEMMKHAQMDRMRNPLTWGAANIMSGGIVASTGKLALKTAKALVPASMREAVKERVTGAMREQARASWGQAAKEAALQGTVEAGVSGAVQTGLQSWELGELSLPTVGDLGVGFAGGAFFSGQRRNYIDKAVDRARNWRPGQKPQPAGPVVPLTTTAKPDPISLEDAKLYLENPKASEAPEKVRTAVALARKKFGQAATPEHVQALMRVPPARMEIEADKLFEANSSAIASTAVKAFTAPKMSFDAADLTPVLTAVADKKPDGVPGYLYSLVNKVRQEVPTVKPEELVPIVNSHDPDARIAELKMLASKRDVTTLAQKQVADELEASSTAEARWNEIRDIAEMTLLTPEGAERKTLLGAIPSKFRRFVGQVAETPEEVADLVTERITPVKLIANKAQVLAQRGVDTEALLRNTDNATANAIWNAAITKDPKGIYQVMKALGKVDRYVELAFRAGYVTSPSDLQGIETLGPRAWLEQRFKESVAGVAADPADPAVTQALAAEIQKGKGRYVGRAKGDSIAAQAVNSLIDQEAGAAATAATQGARTPGAPTAPVASETSVPEVAPFKPEIVDVKGGYKLATTQHGGFRVISPEGEPLASHFPDVTAANEAIDALIQKAARTATSQEGRYRPGEKVKHKQNGFTAVVISQSGSTVTVRTANGRSTSLSATMVDRMPDDAVISRALPGELTVPLEYRPGESRRYSFWEHEDGTVGILMDGEEVGRAANVDEAKKAAYSHMETQSLEDRMAKAIEQQSKAVVTIKHGSAVTLDDGRVLTEVSNVGGRFFGKDEKGFRVYFVKGNVKSVVAPTETTVTPEVVDTPPVIAGDPILTQKGEKGIVTEVNNETGLVHAEVPGKGSRYIGAENLKPTVEPSKADHIGPKFTPEGVLDMMAFLQVRNVKSESAITKALADQLKVAKAALVQVYKLRKRMEMDWGDFTDAQRQMQLELAKAKDFGEWAAYAVANDPYYTARMKYGEANTGRVAPQSGATTSGVGSGIAKALKKNKEKAFLNVGILTDITSDVLQGAQTIAGRAVDRFRNAGWSPVDWLHDGTKDLVTAVRDLSPEGRYVANKMALAIRDRQFLENRFTFTVHDIANRLNNEQRTALNAAFNDVFNRGDEAASPAVAAMDGTTRQAYNDLRAIAQWAHNEQIDNGPFVTEYVNGTRILRPPIALDYWFPNRLDPVAAEVMRTNPNSAQRQSWVNWLMERGGLSEAEANQIITNKLGTTNGAPNSDFKAVRQAEGLGLPPDLRADVLDAFYGYGRDWASDIAFHRNVEQDPIAATALGLPDDGRGNPIEAVEWSPGVPVQSNLREIESVQLLAQAYSRRRNNLARRYGALYQAVSALSVSTFSAARDLVRAPAILGQMAAPGDYFDVIRTFWTHSRAAARAGGAYPSRMASVANFDAETHGALSKVLSNFAMQFNRRTGTEALTEFGASWAFEFGRVMADKHYGEAEFMRRFAPDGWASMDPDYVKRHIAQEMSQSVRGSYDAMELPARLLDETGGPWRYMIGFGRWSVGRFNRWHRHVYTEAVQHGNFKPLMGQLLGIVGTSALVDIFQDEITKTKPAEMTWSEWANSGYSRPWTTLTHQLAASGSAGILADLMYMTSLGLNGEGNAILGYENPLTAMIQDTVMKTTYAIEAIRGGTPWPMAIEAMAKDLAASKIQWAGTLKRHMSEEDPGRRLRRMYLRDVGKLEEDGTRTRSTSTELSYNPYTARGIFGRTTSEATMEELAPVVPPNSRFQDAVQQPEFYDYVKKLQGPRAADRVLAADEAREMMNEKRRAYLSWARPAL